MHCTSYHNVAIFTNRKFHTTPESAININKSLIWVFPIGLSVADDALDNDVKLTIGNSYHCHMY